VEEEVEFVMKGSRGGKAYVPRFITALKLSSIWHKVRGWGRARGCAAPVLVPMSSAAPPPAPVQQNPASPASSSVPPRRSRPQPL
jgi:hypothetical protein